MAALVQGPIQLYVLAATPESKYRVSNASPLERPPRQHPYPKKFSHQISMASSSHPSFPSRPYGANLGKMPDRSLGATFGASTTQQQRESARLERERERLEKERMEREEANQLTEEQREEIKEAVCFSVGAAGAERRSL